MGSVRKSFSGTTLRLETDVSEMSPDTDAVELRRIIKEESIQN
jgi:hypothetical protein